MRERDDMAKKRADDAYVYTLRMPKAMYEEVAEVADARYISANSAMLQAIDAWLREARHDAHRPERVSPAGR